MDMDIRIDADFAEVVAPKPANHDPRVDDDPQLPQDLSVPDNSSRPPSANTPKNVGPPAFNWQASKVTLKERFGFLFGNEVLSDVHFLVGREPVRRRIPAHKFVLSAGSSVFDAMFNGPMAKRKRGNPDAEDSDIELPDIEPSAFMAMLSFLYTDDVEIGPETVMTTLYTAKKYSIPALEQRCVEFLKKNLMSSNAFLLLTQARLFDEAQLAELCLDTIDKHTTDAMQAEGFVDIDLDTLCCVLQRDTLRIAESKLFQAVLWWTEAQCTRKRLAVTPENQRAVLDKALALIRFPLMSVEEFATGPAQSQILSDREVVELFLYFTVNPKPRVRFNDTPRCCIVGKELSVLRFREVESRWGYSGTSDRIRFVVDRRIFVVGFGLYGAINQGTHEYEVTIGLMRTGATKPVATLDTTFSCDGSSGLWRVLFKEPVEVLPNVSYTAAAALKGPDSFYGTNGVNKVTVDVPTGSKVTFHFSFAAGNNNGTSVEDGQIPEILFYV